MNPTYVMFDGDDRKYYFIMKAWHEMEGMSFYFDDVHERRDIRSGSEEPAVKRGLRERFSHATRALLLVGEQTRYQYRYVRWEIEVAQERSLPIVVANLNDLRQYDSVHCPPIMRDYYAVHISFQAKIIQYALNHFPGEFITQHDNETLEKQRLYTSDIYTRLGL